ncbi:MAG TPA: HD domain-containing protein [Candidatus Paceibacterota bacterium]|nr:HD domain-containing protein [Candidatus Paceibacterota bacterium]
MIDRKKIPSFVSHVTKRLQDAGFEAWLVGGCVRDLIMERVPKDWDIATNARPEQVQEVFKDLRTVYENTFGTVTVLNRPVSHENVSGETFEETQVTTYRSEGKYTDFRHPDEVSYETNIEKDLERRDFTMNAIAYDPVKDAIKDIFGGLKDIKDKVIQSVLNPADRFKEDALRMMRAVRFSTQLGFAISHETLGAIMDNKELLNEISKERIRDEFIKIIDSKNPGIGLGLMQKTGLLEYVIPELLEGVGCEQKGAHIYDVFEHIVHALQHAADKGYSLEVRLSALFHDIGKPKTRRYDRSKDKYTFFGHEVVGAKMAKSILERLKFSRETVTRVTTLVRNHMFFSDTEKITLSAVRRIIRNVGPEHIWELMEVRECDRVGMKKKEAPYRLRKYHAMIEEALRDPISVGQLAIDGAYLIGELHMKPGPRMGWILHALLEEVLNDPTKNTAEHLSELAKTLDSLPDGALKALGERGKEKKEELEGQEIEKLHEKHGVKK